MRFIKLFFALGLSGLVCGCGAQFSEDHKIVDASGKTVVDLGSDAELRKNGIGIHFVEGKIIRGDGLHGRYMKLDGQYLPGEYYRCRNFSDGLAAVEPKFELNKEGFEGHKIGFLDAQGNTAMTPQFADVREFREGLCAVRVDGQSLWSVIDKTGKVIVSPQFEEAQVYSQGLMPVQKDGLWGYVDKAGAMKIAPRFAYANCFHDGLALVLLPGEEKLWACVKPDGEVAFECLGDGLSNNRTFEVLENPAVKELIHEHEQNQYGCGFAGGRLRFAKGNKYGFYDTTGKVVIEPVYDYADNFSEGRAAVVRFARPNSTVTFIDTAGKEVVDGNFQQGRPFHEGVAAVQNDKGKWIFIDKFGKQAFDGTFDSAHSLYDGRAVVNYEVSARSL